MEKTYIYLKYESQIKFQVQNSTQLQNIQSKSARVITLAPLTIPIRWLISIFFISFIIKPEIVEFYLENKE